MSISVSIIIPVYNEEKYIGKCLDTLGKQTFPINDTEWLIIDGCSTDRTREIVATYAKQFPIRMLDNPKRRVTDSLNIGIEEAKGKYIIRMDAHAAYDSRYIEKCIYYLETTDADNVGGIAITCGAGFIGKTIAEILSSKFGVGNSGFRTNAESGYVDTVPFGAFRAELFDRIGKFDPELPRSEDNDLNSRIRQSGGKVYLANDIRFTYYCRDTIGGLLEQGIKNGNALFLTLKKNPKAMSLRHYVPFLFVLSLICLPIMCKLYPAFLKLFILELMAYFALDMYFSFSTGVPASRCLKILLYPLFHITYGIGSAIGMLGIKLY